MVDLSKYLMNEWVHFMLHLRLIITKGFIANGKNLCTGLLPFAGAERDALASGGADSERGCGSGSVFQEAVAGILFSWVHGDDSVSLSILRQTSSSEKCECSIANTFLTTV